MALTGLVWKVNLPVIYVNVLNVFSTQYRNCKQMIEIYTIRSICSSSFPQVWVGVFFPENTIFLERVLKKNSCVILSLIWYELVYKTDLSGFQFLQMRSKFPSKICFLLSWRIKCCTQSLLQLSTNCLAKTIRWQKLFSLTTLQKFWKAKVQQLIPAFSPLIVNIACKHVLFWKHWFYSNLLYLINIINFYRNYNINLLQSWKQKL